MIRILSFIKAINQSVSRGKPPTTTSRLQTSVLNWTIILYYYGNLWLVNGTVFRAFVASLPPLQQSSCSGWNRSSLLQKTVYWLPSIEQHYFRKQLCGKQFVWKRTNYHHSRESWRQSWGAIQTWDFTMISKFGKIWFHCGRKWSEEVGCVWIATLDQVGIGRKH